MAVHLNTVTESLGRTLALVEDPQRRALLQHFVDSAGPLAEAAALQALHQMVGEVNALLAPQARVRLFQEAGAWVPEVITTEDDSGAAWRIHLDRDAISRVLIRMPSEVKERASEAAKRAGTSMNAWTVRTLERALGEPSAAPVDPRGRSAPGAAGLLRPALTAANPARPGAVTPHTTPENPMRERETTMTEVRTAITGAVGSLLRRPALQDAHHTGSPGCRRVRDPGRCYGQPRSVGDANAGSAGRRCERACSARGGTAAGGDGGAPAGAQRRRHRRGPRGGVGRPLRAIPPLHRPHPRGPAHRWHPSLPVPAVPRLPPGLRIRLRLGHPGAHRDQTTTWWKTPPR